MMGILRANEKMLFFQIYDKELEKVDIYEGFQDLVKTFELHRGKVKPKEDATVVGEFKVTNLMAFWPICRREQATFC